MKLLRALFVVALALFSAMTFAQAVDINTATAEQLDKGVKGIGPKKAASIVKYREANGPFQSVDDLAKVPGIKGKTLDKIKPMVTVGGVSATPATPAVSVPSAPVAPAKPVTSAPAAPAKLTPPTAPATTTVPAPVAPKQ